MQKCRVCACTDMDACLNSCSWAEKNLCSSCADFIPHFTDFIQNVHRPSAFAVLQLLIIARKKDRHQ